jgi:hypothetical protein
MLTAGRDRYGGVHAFHPPGQPLVLVTGIAGLAFEIASPATHLAIERRGAGMVQTSVQTDGSIQVANGNRDWTVLARAVAQLAHAILTPAVHRAS